MTSALWRLGASTEERTEREFPSFLRFCHPFAQNTVSRNASSICHLGFQPRWLFILEQSNLRKLASCGPSTLTFFQLISPPHWWQKISTNSPVVTQSHSSGPTLYQSAYFPSSYCACAISRYAYSGSSTCWYGRVEYGLRTSMSCPAKAALMQSGTIRFTEKSPPPITLPARAVEIAQRPSAKKLFL